MEKHNEAVRVILRIERLDKSYSEQITYIPHELATRLLIELIEWKHNMESSVTNVEEFLQSEKSWKEVV